MKYLSYIALFLSFFSYGQDSTELMAPLVKISPLNQIMPVNLHGEVYNLSLEQEFKQRNRFDLRYHSFLKPYVEMNPSKTYNKIKYSRVKPLLDGNAFYSESSNASNNFGYRTGAGVSWVASPNNTLHFKLNAVQGIYAGDTVNRPKSYLNWRSGTTNLYTDIRSRISYTPNHIFNFQAGVDHNFYGEGSRSLFLSDYGAPYPFGLIRTRFWRLEYSILYQFLREGSQKNWGGKFSSSHHISFNATKWLNIGIFETVVFNPKDTLLGRGFDVEYLNPVVFYRPQEYSVGSSDNVLLGIDLTARYRQFTFYSQFILDEFYLAEIRAHSQWWANKFGGQFGAKGTFGLGTAQLFLRTEFNFARPYTYAHLNDKLNYGNQGMPLAHPYGANFAELLLEANINFRSWDTYLFVNYALQGGDVNNYNYGGDIYVPYVNRPYEYDHFIGQGAQQNSWLIRTTVSHKLRKLNYASVFVEGNFRYTVQSKKLASMALIGIRMKMWNDYRNY